MAVDPYRTLGLEPGATTAEVKRAYRRLAKAFHPDSAGETALPRFLAIHEAYEQLISGGKGLRGGAGQRPGPGPAAPGEPWRADPARARAAREQARTRRARTAPGPASGPAGPSTGGSATSGTGARQKPGPSDTRNGRGRPGDAGSPAGSRPGERPRRRTARKATLGSTSYDEARDSGDPAWGGAAWYGPTSGEYWTVNPREYADPRKHGPEYQSRARRGSPTGSAWERESESADEPFEDAGSEPMGAGPASRDRAWAVPPAPHATGEQRGPSFTPPPSATLAGILGADLVDPVHRLGLALLAWAPLGVASAAAIGQATGCSTYSASCSGTAPLLPWLAQATILGILLLVPPLSRVLAVGTVAIVLALLPVAGFFITFGGAGQDVGATVLVIALTLAWVAGVAIAMRASWRSRAPGRPR